MRLVIAPPRCSLSSGGTGGAYRPMKERTCESAKYSLIIFSALGSIFSPLKKKSTLSGKAFLEEEQPMIASCCAKT